eukprot:COSAG01_NODE_47354_length_391_cov_0.832192_2_plen_68_part_01
MKLAPPAVEIHLAGGASTELLGRGIRQTLKIHLTVTHAYIVRLSRQEPYYVDAEPLNGYADDGFVVAD